MDNFDKQNLKTLNTKFEKMLKEFAKENGVDVRLGNGKFTNFTFDVKIHMTINNPEAAVENDMNVTLRAYNLNLKSADGTRTLTDFKHSNHKYPFIYSFDNKSWKCSFEQARTYFGRTA
ncbi:MAG: hypothetical protein COA52_00740 [Hyphomicrobiales bacterium]|nr:MAG: hypothetical protein COA52_00740 [Hyphomicrobiales bacterium]